MLSINKIYQGNCIDVMKEIDDNSIDLILCDLPYGITSLKWDSIIPLDKLWEEYKRVAKKDCPIILTASQPFTSVLVTSALKIFKHEWIWEKQKASNFMSFKFQPAKYHENILVFCKGKPTYNPIMWKIDEKRRDKRKTIRNPVTNKECHVGNIVRFRKADDGSRFPKSILKIDKSINKNIHPTEKPVALFEYLIKTYSNEGAIVLDNCIGSGTTAIACITTKRNFIGIDIEQGYVDLAKKRIVEFLSTTNPSQK